MLKVQNYLYSITDDPLLKIKKDFGIESKISNDNKLVILDYSQIDSPKFNDIVEECRGLVLENKTWNLVAKSFNRFYNINEGISKFNWQEHINCTTKHDGSMIIIYYYEKSWKINTRFSFGEGEVNNSGFTWRDLVLQHVDTSKLNPNFTYVGELCGPYNRIVRDYPPSFFLLSVFEKDKEFDYWAWTYEANRVGLTPTQSFEITSQSNVIELLEEIVKKEAGFEGFVLKDCHGIRIKVKHPSYIALHHMVANGNIASPKHLVPILMSGEKDEVLSYFKWLEPYANEYQSKIDKAWKEIDNTWFCFGDEKNRKRFAIEIQKSTKFTYPLFEAFKTGREPKEFFTTDYILKSVFGI